jgi:ABC-2 type transport system permease protein
MQPFFIQLIDLIIIQLTNWRWSWRGTIITSIVAPAISTAALGVFAGNSPNALAYVVTGNMVLSMLFGTLGQVSGNFAYMRANGMLDYFATLPIYRAALIIATVVAFFVLSIPATVVTLLIGTMLLKLPVNISPLIVIVIPLITLTLAGLGALIGLVGNTPETVSAVSNLTTFALISLGPIILPAEQLPEIIRVISYLSPATYAASALRQVVLASVEPIPLVVDMLILISIMLLLLWLVGKRIDWRGK